ncbi:MAG: ROK family protein [Coriobacteriales bacterium]|nr:ROK family protein [Coriobacteriales bacterium]
MAAYVTGDIHGWLDIGKLTPNRWLLGSTLSKSDYLVICGDFGLIWNNPITLEEKFFIDWLDSQPWTTLFVDGNHENYDLLDSFEVSEWHGGQVAVLPGAQSVIHLLRGQVYDMGADGLWFCMGGAPSHDISSRVAGKTWWPREVPSEKEMETGWKNLERVNFSVDYVFSHDVPRHLRRFAMTRHYDPSREVDDSISAFLQKVDEHLDHDRLKMWYSGHYHDDIMVKDRQHCVLYNQVVKLGHLPNGSVHRHMPYCQESWIGIKGIGKQYREWVLSRRIDGCTITWTDNEHISLATSTMFGKIRFYPQEEAPEVVEMSIVRKNDGTPMFRVRFELNDLLHAQELFVEMTDAIMRTDTQGFTRVLLCCNAGITTTLYERRLNDLAESLSLHYEFTAGPLEWAISHNNASYDVVMVAPQLGYRRKDAQEAYPDALVLEIPVEIFARFDVNATLHLLFDALGEAASHAPTGTQQQIVRPIDDTKDVMVISVINREDRSTIGYRVFADKGIALDGMVYKKNVNFRDIQDVLATVKVDGIDVRKLDAVGIAMPGIVNRDSVSLPATDTRDYDLGRELEKVYGIEVYMDNSANAAAMGAYMSQEDYDSVVFHMQNTGVVACSEGVVSDGKLVKGRSNFAGELEPIAWLMGFSSDPYEMVWTYEGMTEIVANYLCASICTVSPDVVYVASPLVRDMDELREWLWRTIPMAYVPDLKWVEDPRELMFLGELALCIDKLTNPRPHRKW